VVERAFKKLFLDAMVVQQGRLSDKHKSASKVYVFAYLLYVSCDVSSYTSSLSDKHKSTTKVYVSVYLIVLRMLGRAA
jgi:hypothetical protein